MNHWSVIKNNQKRKVNDKVGCPYCGVDTKNKILCDNCGKNIEYIKISSDKSISFYNAGYNAAKNSDMTSGIIYLQKALVWNKYNTEARNLLGLLYYRVGKLGDALKEWVISSSIDSNDMANTYINLIQDSPKELEKNKEAIILYNKAREYLQKKNIDVAIIRLRKAVNINSNFVEARVLLGLCYIKVKQYKRAEDNLIKALELDRGNVKALTYINEINDVYNKGYKEDKSSIYISNDKMKISNKQGKNIDRKKLFANSILYFFIGAFVMIMAQKFFVNPVQYNTYEEQIKNLEYKNEELVSKMDEYKEDMENKMTVVLNEKTSLESQNETYKSKLETYEYSEIIRRAKDYIEEKNYIDAASILYTIDENRLTKNQVEGYGEVKELSYIRATNMVYDIAKTYYNIEDYSSAKIEFEKVVAYNTSEDKTCSSLYYLGEIESKLNNTELADNYYKKLINDFPNSREAQMIKDKMSQ